MEEKIKVIEVINCLAGKGGAEVMFCQLCEELLKMNKIDLKIIILHSSIHNDYKNFIEKHKNKIIILDKKKKFDKKAALDFKKTVLEFNPDIINMHLSCVFLYIQSFGFKRQNWKILNTIHNLYKKESSFLERILRYPLVHNDVLDFVGISDLISHSIKKGIKRANVYTIYNGCSIANSSISYSFQRKYDLICVARFSKQKNHMYLIDIVYELKKMIPNIKVALIGDGYLKKKVFEYTVKLNCEKNFEFLGLQSNVFKFLNDSKVFVLSSLFEGNPISILEAMSVGLPIISTGVGGVPDIVKPDKNGYLIPLHDSKESSNTIYNLLLNEKIAKKFSDNNKKTVAMYSIKKCCLNYSKLFFDIVVKGKNRYED